jgi:predicted enzyme related to lactoylglutathione lyase
MSTSTTSPLGTYSEAMFTSTDLDAAVEYWTATLGFTMTNDQRPDWVMLEDSGGQRFALMNAEAAPEPCLGFETTDFEASVAHVLAQGGTVGGRSPEGQDGFQWASCTDAHGVPLMLWQNEA